MSLDSDTRLLSSLPVFGLLEPEAIRMLAFGAETLMFPGGSVVFESGYKADGGLVLAQGKIALETDGKTVDPAKLLAPGALIGRLALLTEVTHRVTARAVEDSQLLKIQRTAFHRILREYPGCAAKVRAAIAEDLIGLARDLRNSRGTGT